tara:strand:+ start:744 stop:4703 length:3960 start_codon:yes stop_codon:yes gene_type:complete
MDTDTKNDIESIQFGVFSNEEILNLSVCEVNNNKMTGHSSIYDNRMGVLNNKELCGSCNKNTKDCPGHFGHVSLNVNLLHPLFYKYILHILKCFCFNCSKCIISEEQIKLNGLNKFVNNIKFNKIVEICDKNDICVHCSHINAKITFNTNDNMYYIVHKSNSSIVKTILSEVDIFSMFNNISNEDIRMIGLNPDNCHPKNLIISSLLVLPPVARPYVIVDNMTCDDDLTIQYCEIIKLNNMLTLDNKLGETKRNKIIQSLKFRVKCLFDNSQEKAKHSNGRPMKGIKKRISGKEGQIRNHIMGKRVDKSARTVIGPDPTLRLDEIALPEKIANTLKYNERVHNLNINHIKKLVERGEIKYIIRGDNRLHLDYAMFRKGTELLYSDVIIKQCGKKIIVGHNTYDYNLKEGDRLFRNGIEMHDIQLKSVKRNFSIKCGDIVERPLKDGDIVLLNRQPTLHRGSMLAQKIKIRPYKTIRMNLAITKTFNADFDGDEMNIHVPASEESNAELRNIVATKWNIISPQSSKSNIAIVQDGLLGTYLLTKENIELGKALFFQLSQSIVDLNVIEKIRYIESKCDKVYTTYNLFSLILPNDLNYIKKDVKIINGILEQGVINKSIIGSSHNSLLQILVKEYGEDAALNFINNVQFLAYAYILHHGFTISIADCISTKSNKINNVIDKCFLEAKGIEHSITDKRICEVKVNASLSKGRDNGMKIAKDALGKSNNFIATVTSGSKGDYFNIAQITGLLGQQNLSGKRIPYTLNNNKRSLPHYSFKIKDKETEYESKGFIKNSFIHGLNPREFWFHSLTGREGITDTAMKTATSGYIQRRIIKLSEDVLINYDSTVRNSSKNIIQFQYGDDNLDACKTVIIDGIPQICDIKRLVYNLNEKFDKCINRKLTNEEKIYILSVIKANNGLPKDIKISTENIIKKNLLLQLDHIFIQDERLIEEIKNNIEYHYYTSQIQPGESVGIITGESIGERQTQMTLNTFHSAGLAISTVLTGVPRFSELLNATKDPKSILCNVYMKEQGKSIQDIRETIGNKIRCIKLKDLVKKFEIFTSRKDDWWYDDYSLLYENDNHMNYSIGIKFKLDKEKMFLNFIDTQFVSSKLEEYVQHIMYYDEHLHIFMDSDNEMNDYYYLHDIILTELFDIQLCGIEGINDFFYQKDDNNHWYITCDGSNMIELFKLDFINIYETHSNNMWEIYSIYGIEAVRQFLIDEFLYVVSSDGTYINERHVKLLVDIMTQHGVISSISRYGMKKDNSGPIAKASFEQSLDNFVKASFHSENELLNGVSSNIMCGKKINVGSNMCNLYQDLSYLNV